MGLYRSYRSLTVSVPLRRVKEPDLGVAELGPSDVVVDLERRRLVVKLGAGRAVVPLDGSDLKYIRQRLEEGAALAGARVWSAGGFLHVRLTFMREVQPYVPEAEVYVTTSGLSGVGAVAFVQGRPVETLEFPLPERLFKLQDRLLGGRSKKALKRMRGAARAFAEDVAHKVVELALRYKAGITLDLSLDAEVARLRGEFRLVDVLEEALRHLERRTESLARWYGVPVRRR